MSETNFGEHDGHLTAEADHIARVHAAWHVNHTQPDGRRRGWFSCQDSGNQHTAMAVLADIDAAGGLEALRVKGNTDEFFQYGGLVKDWDAFPW